MISAKIDEADLNKMIALMDEMQRTTKAEMPKVIRNTARDIVRAAKRHTPKAESGLERWVVFNRGGKRVYVKASKVKPKYRGKSKRLKVLPGLAWAGWNGALARLGVNFKKPAKSSMKHSALREVKSGNSVMMEIGNTTPFIEDLDRGNYANGSPHHIMQRAIREVNQKTEERLQRMADRIVRKAIGI